MSSVLGTNGQLAVAKLTQAQAAFAEWIPQMQAIQTSLTSAGEPNSALCLQPGIAGMQEALADVNNALGVLGDVESGT